MAIVVIIEDDRDIACALCRGLGECGHEVRTEHTGLAALGAATEGDVDAVVLDLGLPDIDGQDVLKMLRAVSSVPVIVATARDGDDDIVRSLDAGADDYVVKPFSSQQLDARIRAVLRRTTSGAEPKVIDVDGLHVDPTTREVALDGRPIHLSPKEFDLLHHLARHGGRVVTKRELLAAVWNQPWGGADKTVDVHISWLRRKLGESAAEPRFLRSVHGVGIRFVNPSAPG